MNALKPLRERRDAVAKALHELMETNSEGWTQKHTEQYDTGMAEIQDLDTQIKRIMDYEELIAEQGSSEQIAESADRLAKDRKGTQASKGAELFARWVRGGDNALSAEEWRQVRATMSTTTDAEGGYTVQTDVANEISDALAQFGGMREAATVFATAMGNPMNFPTSDGTSETGELIGENTTATGADPTFGVVNLNTYKYSSKIVAVPFELLQDSEVDLEPFIQRRLTQRVGRITNTHFTTGTGTGQPRGIVTASSVGKTGTTGQTTTVIFDDLVDLVHSVDPAYRALNRCRFMLHDDSMKIVRKLKDSQGRPIFLPGFDGLAGPMPDSLLGYPVTINQDVAQMAANAKSILFGDFSYYLIRDVMAFTMFRFTDSAYIKLGQIGFLMWSRHAGNFVDVGGAVKHYANSAT